MKKDCGPRRRRLPSASTRSSSTARVPMARPRQAKHADLQRNIINFCRLLRDREMLVTPSEVIDAIKTADAVDIADRQEFKTALRSVLTARPEDIPIHDATFDEFWRGRLPDRMEERGEEGVATQDDQGEGEELPQPQGAEGDDANADDDDARLHI